MLPALTGNAAPIFASQLPVTIYYPSALALRQMALVQDELPKYLLALLHNVPDLHRKMRGLKPNRAKLYAKCVF